MKDLARLLPFVLIALVFWLLILRPQRRRQQKLSETQASLGVGSEVMLGSGIYGTVASLEDETVHVEVAPGTVVKVARAAVVRVVSGPLTDNGIDSDDPRRELDDGFDDGFDNEAGPEDRPGR